MIPGIPRNLSNGNLHFVSSITCHMHTHMSQDFYKLALEKKRKTCCRGWHMGNTQDSSRNRQHGNISPDLLTSLCYAWFDAECHSEKHTISLIEQWKTTQYGNTSLICTQDAMVHAEARFVEMDVRSNKRQRVSNMPIFICKAIDCPYPWGADALSFCEVWITSDIWYLYMCENMSLSQSLSSLVSLSFTIYYINLFVALQWWIFVQLHQRPISWTKVTWRIPELTRCHLTYYWLHNATVHTWKCWRSCQTSQNLHCARFCSGSEWINESKRVSFCCSKLNVFSMMSYVFICHIQLQESTQQKGFLFHSISFNLCQICFTSWTKWQLSDPNPIQATGIQYRI